MQRKLICLVVIVALIFAQVEAEDDDERKDDEDDEPIVTNRGLDFEPMKPQEVKYRSLKCIPGRTVVQMKSSQDSLQPEQDDDEEDSRRTHMNWKVDKTKEACQICTCSLAGHDEYCSGRPAKNLNECLMLAKLTEQLQSNIPFDHERELSNRIRRYGAQKGLGRPACIPYISEYNDCSEYTTCRGCNQCRCNAQGQWACYKKRNTCSDGIDEIEIYEDGTDENVVGNILKELAKSEQVEKTRKPPTHRAPLPEKRKRVTDSPILGYLIAVLQ